MQQQIQTIAQVIQREMLEKLRRPEPQQQDQITTILKELPGLSERKARRITGGGADHLHEMHSLKKETQELQATIGKLSTAPNTTSNVLIPDLQKEVRALKAQLGALASQAPSEAPCELVSERATAEIDSVLDTRSASSPAQSSDVTRALQEEVQQIDAKATFSLFERG